MKRLLTTCGLATLCSLASADDFDALKLADQTPNTAATTSSWRSFAEVAVTRYAGSDTPPNPVRLSLDVQYDGKLAPAWRAVLTDRFDYTDPHVTAGQNGVNTIKEAYVSWQASDALLFDGGRINARNGVAMGYNPTDWFRQGALRTVLSPDPSSLRENRQGSMMLRAQTLWDGGSASLAWSPKFSTIAHNAGWNPDIAATNHEGRWLLTLSQKFGTSLTPQVLLYQAGSSTPQVGLNLTTLLNDATVAYVEWSGGKSPSLLTQALRQQGLPATDDARFRQRAALGMTWTHSSKLSLTAEWEFNGAGLDADRWDALRATPGPFYALYRGMAAQMQDLPTRRALFLYANWQDALLNHLDLSALTRIDQTDHSRLSWLEMRYHEGQSEIALQWQQAGGAVTSTYGATRRLNGVAVIVRGYF